MCTKDGDGRREERERGGRKGANMMTNGIYNETNKAQQKLSHKISYKMTNSYVIESKKKIVMQVMGK